MQATILICNAFYSWMSKKNAKVLIHYFSFHHWHFQSFPTRLVIFNVPHHKFQLLSCIFYWVFIEAVIQQGTEQVKLKSIHVLIFRLVLSILLSLGCDLSTLFWAHVQSTLFRAHGNTREFCSQLWIFFLFYYSNVWEKSVWSLNVQFGNIELKNEKRNEQLLCETNKWDKTKI